MADETVIDLTGVDTLRNREQGPRGPLTPLEASRTDAVADYFRQKGEEPNYEEISRMAPPLKYVNAAFRVYPLVLGDKDGLTKVRLLSNANELHLDVAEENPGDGIDGENWFGCSERIRFFVGDGVAPQNVSPRWREGYLPVAELTWEQAGARYTMEAFATLLPDTTECLCAWVRVNAKRLVAEAEVVFGARFEGGASLKSCGGYLVHEAEEDRPLRAGYSDGWEFDDAAQSLTWRLPAGQDSGEAFFVAVNKPAPHGMLLEWPGERPRGWAIDMERSRANSGLWLAQWAEPEFWTEVRDNYCRSWDEVLAEAGEVSIPESVVNNAHKAVRIASQVIATRNQMSYSAHNAYERSYTDESAQPAIGLALWGHTADAARYLGQVAFYSQNGLTIHDLGLRLHWFCRYISLTDDQEFYRRNRQRMRRWAYELMDSITPEQHGLTPLNNHCGDLHHKVYSLSANSIGWRGARDFAVLAGDTELEGRVEQFRQAIRNAAEATIDNSVEPPFLPMALYGDEPTPDTITSTTLGAYWALMAPYALYAGSLGDDHPGTRAMLDTYEQRGGLCAGLVRFTIFPDYSKLTCLVELGLDDLYGIKLSDTYARLDNAEQLVLALYGKLGLGLTHDTFIAGEGASLAPSRIFGDESSDGRSFYLPPSSTSQMMLAIVLRDCLVFDFDSRGDGRYDTLRLAFSTPRRWLEEGECIAVDNMPTAFGPVSYIIVSHIDSKKAVDVTVDLPSRCNPEHGYFRLRVPTTNRQTLKTVTINGHPHTAFDSAAETIDLSGHQGRLQICAEYA